MGYLKSAFVGGWLGVLVTGSLTAALLYQSWQVNHAPNRMPVELKVGDKMPAVQFETPQGQTVDVDWRTSGKQTIVYFFRPDCVWCARNMAAFKTLLAGAPEYRIIGISPTAEGVDEYLKSNDLRLLEVYFATDTGTVKKLKLTGTPETIVLTPGGVVEEVWKGAYRGRNEKQIEEKFGVTLPEVQISDATQHRGT